MKTKLIIEGNSVYEIDEECRQRKVKNNMPCSQNLFVDKKECGKRDKKKR